MSKQANLIIVGGTIAAGKSTLVDEISKAIGWVPIPELREGDFLQEQILHKLYEGKRLHLATIQYYFLANRFRQYEDASRSLIPSILDRGLWEDWIFAKLLMKDEQKSYAHYKILWNKVVQSAVSEFGLPKAYIFVKVDWETFRERIYNRNREAEISNFAKNEAYFRSLLAEYNQAFVSLLEAWRITPIIIDSKNMSKLQMVDFAINSLKERNLL